MQSGFDWPWELQTDVGQLWGYFEKKLRKVQYNSAKNYMCLIPILHYDLPLHLLIFTKIIYIKAVSLKVHIFSIKFIDLKLLSLYKINVAGGFFMAFQFLYFKNWWFFIVYRHHSRFNVKILLILFVLSPLFAKCSIKKKIFN